MVEVLPVVAPLRQVQGVLELRLRVLRLRALLRPLEPARPPVDVEMRVLHRLRLLRRQP